MLPIRIPLLPYKLRLDVETSKMLSCRFRDYDFEDKNGEAADAAAGEEANAFECSPDASSTFFQNPMFSGAGLVVARKRGFRKKTPMKTRWCLVEILFEG